MTHIIIMATLIIMFLSIVFISAKYAIRKEQQIYTNGIETTSVVCENEQYLNQDCRKRHRCYVRYRGNDGKEHVGLLNVRSNLPLGRKVHIRYLPSKYDTVVFVSQEIE